MDIVFNIIHNIIGFGFSLISLVFTIIIAIIVGVIALFKRRNGLIWGIIGFFFPWIILVMPFIPKKYPRFPMHIKNNNDFKGKNPVVASIMALAAIVAKSDGSVTKEEIRRIKEFISNSFGIVGAELDSYAGVFEYGKNHPEEYQVFTRIITEYYGRSISLAIGYLLVEIAMVNGALSEQEDLLIRKILLEIGISEYEYNSIKYSFNRQGQDQYGYQEQYFSSQPTNLVKKYCEILGVSEDASMNEIKKAYRKLVKEYHPDKLASESMPEEYKEFANKKIIEINEAYEYLKKLKEHE